MVYKTLKFLPQTAFFNVVERFGDVSINHGIVPKAPRNGSMVLIDGQKFRITEIVKAEYRQDIVVERVL